jgi:hypothetical protein
MPLTGSEDVLAEAIKAELLTDPSCKEGESLDKLAGGIARAVIQHVVANAVVETAGTAAAQVGVIV